MTRTHRAWVAVASMVGLVATPMALALVAPGLAGAVPGNNGTVKIAQHGDVDQIPQNAPHQGCIFQVEWYGFDEGADVISTVTFADHSPTGTAGLSVSGDTTVFVGEDGAGGAGNDPDGVAVYTLSFTGEPHPQQGYHVSLTIETPHSHGADVKHKMFWVQGCAPPQSPPPTTPTSPPPTTPTSPPPTTPTSPPPTTPASPPVTTPASPPVKTQPSPQGTGTTSPQPDVLGEQASVEQSPGQQAPLEVAGQQAQVPTVVNAGAAPDGLSSSQAPAWAVPVAAAGGALLTAGLFLAWASRRRGHGAHAAH